MSNLFEAVTPLVVLPRMLGVVVSVVDLIHKVNSRWVWFVLGWVILFGWLNHLGM